MTQQTSGSGSGSVESLYPFLYADRTEVSTNRSAILEQVRASTVAKAAEIVELRQAVLDRHGASLAACAVQLAARFAAGGRLLAFGNGGSATDAQQLVTTFVDPGGTARPLPAIGLASDPAVLTALVNDIGSEIMFARQIAALGMLTVGIAGYQGGRMAELDSISYLFVAPSASVHRIQEAQTTMYNALWELCQAALASGAS
jgi:D-sedoheptulose 7-phosphate isomerase